LVRSVNVNVSFHSGFSGCDYPVRINSGETQSIIKRILKEWREPGYKFYLVETKNQKYYKLIFIETSGKWRIIDTNLIK